MVKLLQRGSASLRNKGRQKAHCLSCQSANVVEVIGAIIVHAANRVVFVTSHDRYDVQGTFPNEGDGP
jgi:hypothetical protein